jgi:hypothetical protein
VTDLEDGASGMWYCDVAGGEFQPEYPEGQRMVAEILRLAARVRELESILADGGRVLFIHGPEEMADETKVRAMRAHGKREERFAAADAVIDQLRADLRTERTGADALAEENRALKEERDRLAYEAGVGRALHVDRGAALTIHRARVASLEADRAEIEQIIAADLTADLVAEGMSLPDQVRQAILYAQAGNEYGAPALKLRIAEMEAIATADALEIYTRRRQQAEAAAALREALDEQGRLRLENHRLAVASGEAEAALLMAPCSCGGGFVCSRCKGLDALRPLRPLMNA